MSLEIKSYYFQTLFHSTFSWFQYDFIQKSLRKKVLLYSRKYMGTKTIFKMQMHRKKYFSDLTSLGLFFFVYIFFRTLIPVILFHETLLLAAPILFQEKKSQESKTKDFSRTFFRGLSYIDSNKIHLHFYCSMGYCVIKRII